MKFEFDWPSGFRGEDVWNCGRTDGRRTDAGVTGILLAHPGAFGSGELTRWMLGKNMAARIRGFMKALQKHLCGCF